MTGDSLSFPIAYLFLLEFFFIIALPFLVMKFYVGIYHNYSEIFNISRELQNGLSELLEDAGEIAGKEKILILMDGTDLIETTGGFSPLRWLPDPVPKVNTCSFLL